ncbi:hypothetical protein [Vitiosangium sp. GDMCC 1.1324]|uniref:hypothetical protein n=1 Tax=Vitiosangium sp. (strain GDMCC 1.1324) TaxID=2138576 RepID=UPI0011B8487E|nr:hypothetical protein [Vitiosangium sp. GDMCC 1.1324]
MRLWNFGAYVLALLVVACGGESVPVTQGQGAEGTLRLPLVSPGPYGDYRLVGATFNITGPQTVTITDTSPDTVHAALMAGAYTIELAGSWHLERTDAPGTVVPAQLLSPNPLSFYVTKDQLSDVRFLFKIAGSGAADVGFKVDQGGWIAGTLQFTARESPGNGPSVLDELVGKSVPFVIGFESSALNRGTSRDLNVQAIGPLTVQFGGPHSDLLAHVAASISRYSYVYFNLRATPSGLIESGPIQIWSEDFALELLPSAPSPGVLDSEGYPAPRLFQFETEGALRSSHEPGNGVRGPASVNLQP